MDKLPDSLSARFRFYLNILPMMEKYLMYTLLVGGVLFILFSLYKFIKIRKSKFYNYPWVEDDLVYNIDRKLSSYIPERRISTKELEVLVHNLTVPFNDNTISRED